MCLRIHEIYMPRSFSKLRLPTFDLSIYWCSISWSHSKIILEMLLPLLNYSCHIDCSFPEGTEPLREGVVSLACQNIHWMNKWTIYSHWVEVQWTKQGICSTQFQEALLGSAVSAWFASGSTYKQKPGLTGRAFYALSMVLKKVVDFGPSSRVLIRKCTSLPVHSISLPYILVSTSKCLMHVAHHRV